MCDSHCVFCERYKDKESILMENESCFAIYDKFPVNHGHILILPKEHKKDFFSLSYREHEDMNILIRNCKTHLDKTLSPDGYNIGYNVGEWAGQTIFHCHAHLIPRFGGDVPVTELKGGIRNFKNSVVEY